MESIDAIQKVYGASYQESRRLFELKHCRYSISILSKRGSGPVKVHHEWHGLRLDQVTRFSWYFRYRAAAEQIQNAKIKVYFEINKTYTNIDHRTALIKTITSKLRNAKAKLTQATTKLNQIKGNWTELFPVQEHPHYAKVEHEIERRKSRIQELQSELEAANNDNISELLKKHHII